MADTIERLATCARQLLDAGAEIERLRADLVEIAEIADIAPTNYKYGSLAVRMQKVWLIACGNEQEPKS